MRRQEFIDSITTWSELMDFCYEEQCDCCDGIYSEDSRNSIIDEELVEMAREARDWRELLRQLDDIPIGSEYYLSCYGEWVDLCDGDSYFDEYKEDVLSWADDHEVWDEEEEEEFEPDEVEDIFENDDTFEIDESESVQELMVVCSSQLQRISESKNKEDISKLLPF